MLGTVSAAVSSVNKCPSRHQQQMSDRRQTWPSRRRPAHPGPPRSTQVHPSPSPSYSANPLPAAAPRIVRLSPQGQHLPPVQQTVALSEPRLCPCPPRTGIRTLLRRAPRAPPLARVEPQPRPLAAGHAPRAPPERQTDHLSARPLRGECGTAAERDQRAAPQNGSRCLFQPPTMPMCAPSPAQALTRRAAACIEFSAQLGTTTAHSLSLMITGRF